MDKLEALRRSFGYDEFRPGQEGVVDALLGGRDGYLCTEAEELREICAFMSAWRD